MPSSRLAFFCVAGSIPATGRVKDKLPTSVTMSAANSLQFNQLIGGGISPSVINSQNQNGSSNNGGSNCNSSSSNATTSQVMSPTSQQQQHKINPAAKLTPPTVSEGVHKSTHSNISTKLYLVPSTIQRIAQRERSQHDRPNRIKMTTKTDNHKYYRTNTEQPNNEPISTIYSPHHFILIVLYLPCTKTNLY